MAKQINITPGAPPAVAGSRTSRRDILAAAEFSGLAAIAVGGFVRPDAAASSVAFIHPDGELLRACAAFEAAHEAQEHDSAMPIGDDAETARIGHEWSAALSAVSAAPRPKTPAGRAALAHVAHVALIDQITGCGTDLVSEVASPEEALAIMALDAMRSAVA